MAHAKTLFPTVLASALMLAASTGAIADESTTNVLDPQADALLKKMSDYMGGLKSFSADAFVFDEQVRGDGFKLSVLRSGSIKVQRPNKFYIARKGMIRDQEAFFDGSKLVLHAKRLKAALEIPIRGDINAGLNGAAEPSGNELPARDLLSSDAYTPLIDAVEESIYLGTVDIAGVTCRQMAFRTAEVDWQLWVEEGDRPLPCRYTITEKWVTSAPQYTVTFVNWQVNEDIPASAFEFSAPAGTKTLTVEEFREAVASAGSK